MQTNFKIYPFMYFLLDYISTMRKKCVRMGFLRNCTSLIIFINSLNFVFGTKTIRVNHRTFLSQGFLSLQEVIICFRKRNSKLAVADLGGAAPARAPPTAQNFLNFMQFFTKFGKIICWRPPWRVGAPSYGVSWIRP